MVVHQFVVVRVPLLSFVKRILNQAIMECVVAPTNHFVACMARSQRYWAVFRSHSDNKRK